MGALFMSVNSVEIVDPVLKLIGGSFAKELTDISVWSVIVRILLPFLFAGTIGLERAAKKHAAGLRTYILVCIGAAAVTMANQFIYVGGVNTDAARLGLGVVQGVGFLGAGTILVTSRNQIKGLTTAAGLWTVACLGIVIGCGFYTAAVIMYAMILLVMIFLPKFERQFTNKRGIIEIHVEFEERANLKTFVNYVREENFKVISVEHNPAYANSGLSVYTIVVSARKECQFKTHKQFVDMVSSLDYVEYVEEI